MSLEESLVQCRKRGAESVGYLAPELWAATLVIGVTRREQFLPSAKKGDEHAREQVEYFTAQSTALVEKINYALTGGEHEG